MHGALYEAPAAKEIAVIIQHGAAMNFYTGMGRFLPAILLGRSYSCLSANNRGMISALPRIMIKNRSLA